MFPDKSTGGPHVKRIGKALRLTHYDGYYNEHILKNVSYHHYSCSGINLKHAFFEVKKEQQLESKRDGLLENVSFYMNKSKTKLEGRTTTKINPRWGHSAPPLRLSEALTDSCILRISETRTGLWPAPAAAGPPPATNHWRTSDTATMRIMNIIYIYIHCISPSVQSLKRQVGVSNPGCETIDTLKLCAFHRKINIA